MPARVSGDLRLGTIVTAVQWRRGAVEIRATANETLQVFRGASRWRACRNYWASARASSRAARPRDWQADPFRRGAYSYTGVGGTGARVMLARSVDGRLFFAGEATHTGQSGTVAGAIASGYRAAEKILEARNGP